MTDGLIHLTPAERRVLRFLDREGAWTSVLDEGVNGGDPAALASLIEAGLVDTRANGRIVKINYHGIAALEETAE